MSSSFMMCTVLVTCLRRHIIPQVLMVFFFFPGSLNFLLFTFRSFVHGKTFLCMVWNRGLHCPCCTWVDVLESSTVMRPQSHIKFQYMFPAFRCVPFASHSPKRAVITKASWYVFISGRASFPIFPSPEEFWLSWPFFASLQVLGQVLLGLWEETF